MLSALEMALIQYLECYISAIIIISSSKREINKRQNGHDRFKAFKHENSQKQFGISFVKGHVHLAWKL